MPAIAALPWSFPPLPLGLSLPLRRLADRLARPLLWLAIVRPSGADRTDDPAASLSDRTDHRAFQRQMLPHLDAAYSLARYLTRDPTLAEDVVQEAYLRAFRAFDSFRGGDEKAFILRIVRNCAYTHLSLRRQDPLANTQRPAAGDEDEGDDALTNLVSEADTAETSLIRRDETTAVRETIASLPDHLREVLVLRELEDFSYQQIADLTDVPLGTVMSRLARARAAFARLWSSAAATGKAPR